MALHPTRCSPYDSRIWRAASQSCLGRSSPRPAARLGAETQGQPRALDYVKQLRFYTSPIEPAESAPVTLVTQVSLDRWPRFQQQAAAWRGPVSVAVYLPAPAGSAAAAAAEELLLQLCQEHAANHPEQAMLVATLHALQHAREGSSALPEGAPPPTPAKQLTYDLLYPINALRNLAMVQASTPHVMLTDADFIPSRGMEQQLAARCAEGMGSSPPVMLVVPAFQVVLPEQEVVADEVALQVPTTKQELLKALDSGLVTPFQCGVFPERQPSLDYDLWAASSQPLPLTYQEYFEAFGVASKQHLPAFDERFRGYGLNKVQHTYHAAAVGFQFEALPSTFLVTAPHHRAASWRPTPGTRSDKAHMQRIISLYGVFKEEMRTQHAGYQPPM